MYGSTYSRNGPNVPYVQYKILTDADSTKLYTNPNIIKKSIKEIDQDLSLEKCVSKAPLIAQVVIAGGSWPNMLLIYNFPLIVSAHLAFQAS